MSYVCGIGPGMESLGFTPCEPHYLCDGCGRRKYIHGRGAGRNIAPAWHLDGKAPPGWKKDGKKTLCEVCRKLAAKEAE